MIVNYDEDIVLAKVASIRKCILVIKNLWFENDPEVPEWIRRDVTVLNIQRAVEACLDLANHLIAANSLGLPGSAAEAVSILIDQRILPSVEASVFRGMIGFRNIAVHNYREIDGAIVSGIVHDHLGDLEDFATAVLDATLRRDRESPGPGPAAAD